MSGLRTAGGPQWGQFRAVWGWAPYPFSKITWLFHLLGACNSGCPVPGCPCVLHTVQLCTGFPLGWVSLGAGEEGHRGVGR